MAAGTGRCRARFPDGRGIRVGFLSRHRLSRLDDEVDFPPGLAAVQVRDEPLAPTRRMGRGALVVRVEPSPDVEIELVTCHLKSKLLSYPTKRFVPRNEYERARYGSYALDLRAAEATTVRSLVSDRLAARDANRLVLLGDLNDETSAASNQIVLGPPGSEIGTRGFRQPDRGDRWRMWNLAPLMPAGKDFSRRFAGRPELIDHILVSHALLDVITDVRAETGHPLPSVDPEDPQARRDTPDSDHAPVVVRLNL